MEARSVQEWMIRDLRVSEETKTTSTKVPQAPTARSTAMRMPTGKTAVRRNRMATLQVGSDDVSILLATF